MALLLNYLGIDTVVVLLGMFLYVRLAPFVSFSHLSLVSTKMYLPPNKETMEKELEPPQHKRRSTKSKGKMKWKPKLQFFQCETSHAARSLQSLEMYAELEMLMSLAFWSLMCLIISDAIACRYVGGNFSHQRASTFFFAIVPLFSAQHLYALLLRKKWNYEFSLSLWVGFGAFVISLFCLAVLVPAGVLEVSLEVGTSQLHKGINLLLSDFVGVPSSLTLSPDERQVGHATVFGHRFCGDIVVLLSTCISRCKMLPRSRIGRSRFADAPLVVHQGTLSPQLCISAHLLRCFREASHQRPARRCGLFNLARGMAHSAAVRPWSHGGHAIPPSAHLLSGMQRRDSRYCRGLIPPRCLQGAHICRIPRHPRIVRSGLR